ncbi:MAG: hypothetical protein AAGI54_10305 [Planctomycetota bacterium]
MTRFLAAIVAVTALTTVTAAPLRALPLQGTTSETLPWGQQVELTVTIDTAADVVTTTFIGPSDRWFDVGFGSMGRTNTTGYAIAGNGLVNEVSFPGLGSFTFLSPISIVERNDVDAGVRTVVLTRPINAISSFNFPTIETTIDLNFSASRFPTTGYAVDPSNRVGSSLTLTEVPEPATLLLAGAMAPALLLRRRAA